MIEYVILDSEDYLQRERKVLLLKKQFVTMLVSFVLLMFSCVKYARATCVTDTFADSEIKSCLEGKCMVSHHHAFSLPLGSDQFTCYKLANGDELKFRLKEYVVNNPTSYIGMVGDMSFHRVTSYCNCPDISGSSSYHSFAEPCIGHCVELRKRKYLMSETHNVFDSGKCLLAGLASVVARYEYNVEYKWHVFDILKGTKRAGLEFDVIAKNSTDYSYVNIDVDKGLFSYDNGQYGIKQITYDNKVVTDLSGYALFINDADNTDMKLVRKEYVNLYGKRYSDRIGMCIRKNGVESCDRDGIIKMLDFNIHGCTNNDIILKTNLLTTHDVSGGLNLNKISGLNYTLSFGAGSLRNYLMDNDHIRTGTVGNFLRDRYVEVIKTVNAFPVGPMFVDEKVDLTTKCVFSVYSGEHISTNTIDVLECTNNDRIKRPISMRLSYKPVGVEGTASTVCGVDISVYSLQDYAPFTGRMRIAVPGIDQCIRVIVNAASINFEGTSVGITASPTLVGDITDGANVQFQIMANETITDYSDVIDFSLDPVVFDAKEKLLLLPITSKGNFTAYVKVIEDSVYLGSSKLRILDGKKVYKVPVKYSLVASKVIVQVGSGNVQKKSSVTIGLVEDVENSYKVGLTDIVMDKFTFDLKSIPLVGGYDYVLIIIILVVMIYVFIFVFVVVITAVYNYRDPLYKCCGIIPGCGLFFGCLDCFAMCFKVKKKNKNNDKKNSVVSTLMPRRGSKKNKYE